MSRPSRVSSVTFSCVKGLSWVFAKQVYTPKLTHWAGSEGELGQRADDKHPQGDVVQSWAVPFDSEQILANLDIRRRQVRSC